MTEIAIKILQGSAVAENSLGKLVIYHRFCIFSVVRISANCKSCQHVTKLCAKTNWEHFLRHCIMCVTTHAFRGRLVFQAALTD